MRAAATAALQDYVFETDQFLEMPMQRGFRPAGKVTDLLAGEVKRWWLRLLGTERGPGCDAHPIDEEFMPLLKQSSRMFVSDLHVSVVLPDVPILHVERLGNEKKDRRLKGEKVRLGRVVPEMPGGF